MLLPNTRPSNEEGSARDEQQMQDDNSNNSRLKELQPVGNNEMANTESGSVHLLAFQQKNDGQSGFHGIIESDYEQIAQAQPEV